MTLCNRLLDDLELETAATDSRYLLPPDAQYHYRLNISYAITYFVQLERSFHIMISLERKTM